MRSSLRTSWWSSLHTSAGGCIRRGASRITGKLKLPQEHCQQYRNVSHQWATRRLSSDRLPSAILRGVSETALSQLKDRPHLYALFGVAAAVSQLVLEKVPISGRWRMNFSSDRLLETAGLSKFIAYMELLERTALPDTAPEVKLVRKVVDRLALHNDLQHIASKLKIVVISDNDPLPYAGVAYSTLIVDRGLLQIADTEDLLAMVLAHEIAHIVADHAGERLSLEMASMPIWVPIEFLLCMYHNNPDFAGLVRDLLFVKPLRRKLESEADYMGLMMMARSYYNPKVAPIFFERSAIASETRAHLDHVWSYRRPWFLSTHPRPHERIQKLKEW